MNQEQVNQDPFIDLPKPQSPDKLHSAENAQVGNSVGGEASASIGLEKGISNPGLVNSGGPVAAMPPSSTVASSITPMSASSATAVTSSVPAIADDVDLIEKEWVEKAKTIVSRTKTDPYIQNNEMSKVKADYLKKRYNKDIKLAEG